MNIKGVRNYLATALQGFVVDPADTDFQRGYQAALEELSEVIGGAIPIVLIRNAGRAKENA